MSSILLSVFLSYWLTFYWLSCWLCFQCLSVSLFLLSLSVFLSVFMCPSEILIVFLSVRSSVFCPVCLLSSICVSDYICLSVRFSVPFISVRSLKDLSLHCKVYNSLLFLRSNWKEKKHRHARVLSRAQTRQDPGTNHVELRLCLCFHVQLLMLRKRFAPTLCCTHIIFARVHACR